MPPVRFICEVFGEELEAGFASIRHELDVPAGFPEPVLAEAHAAATRGPAVPDAYVDRTDLELVTIDPRGSIDLDQAFAAEQHPGGYRVWYAIADVAAFVEPNGAIDNEARTRGVTLYSPDRRASLHPEILNESAASLLAGTKKPALLWRIDLDADGSQVDAHLGRAWVRSREQLSYADAQARIDDGTDNESLRLLRTIGRLRQQLESERGAVSLQLPAQEITHRANGDYELHFDISLPVEKWNAQISLLTGMAAAQMMLDAGHGLLRTLPPLHAGSVAQVRRAARALDVEWDADTSYPDRMRLLDPNVPREAALLTRAARSFRGAGYAAFFDGDVPEQPLHGAIASTYAHVTAPLRRVCDRYANELVLAHCAGTEAPEWALEGLDELPKVMALARQRDRALERAIVDYVETVALRSRIGDAFEGVVLSHRRKGANVQLRDPAVVASVRTKPAIGSVVDLVLDAVDTVRRTLDFRVRE